MKSRHHHNYNELFLTTVQSESKSRFSLLKVIFFWSASLLTGCGETEKPVHKLDLTTSELLPELCNQNNDKGNKNTITADVVALEQIITFNRFGAFNPAGMVYALRKDVVDEQGKDISALSDNEMAGLAGKVRLKDTKRPRPLVLRVHEGECLQVKFWNLLSPLPTIHTTFQRPDFPEGGIQRQSVQSNPATGANLADLSTPPRDPKLPNSFPLPSQEESDFPTTRSASIHVNGLDYANMQADGANVGKNPSSLAEPGKSKTYTWYARQEGGYFMYSVGALAGGEGDGGQLGLGLFGSINVEPKGSIWYRSQVTNKDLVEAADSDSDYSHIKYDDLAIVKDGVIQHSDLNAIIYQTEKTNETVEVCSTRSPGSSCGMSFREFTTIFHDANKVFQAFAELSDEGSPLRAIADGMAINYGSSGVGSVVMANKKKIGPSKDCPDCKLEEFFLSSWVNGDPAMIVRRNIDGKETEALYPDDPSNVHHSYLGDPVRFRNIHAGPKETHVFHLHAHQWLQDKNEPNANYLDSQTISPGSSYTYDIQYGGGGNRNLTVGDAIFHCHLYPHFAAGMWELWRNHDVFEDGKPGLYDKNKNPDPRLRNLPDAEIAGGSPNPAIVPIPGFPLAPLPTAEFRGYPFFMAAEPGHRPPQPPLDMALNDKATAPEEKWLDGGLPRHIITEGTIKILNPNELIEGHGDPAENKASRYVAKRTWQLNSDPNNLALAKEMESATVKILPQCGTASEILAMAYHAGWDKHTITGLKQGTQPANMPDKIWQACHDDFNQVLTDLPDAFDWNYQSQPTVWPINRMIHSDPAKPQSPLAAMSALWKGVGYESTNAATPKNHETNKAFDPGKQFRINGFAPAQGAPFADPCPSEYYEDATKDGKPVSVNRLSPRIYKSAYIQFDMTVNKYGWHDPQARMPVLEEDAAATLDGTRLAEPLFFRANSGDCIQFQATNLIPSVLNLDDFQVYSPTDTIGQHIHLVKFDVTSSDGSANGWNYEDGTFSPDEVRERIDASNFKNGANHTGKVVDWKGQPSNALLKAKTHPMFMDKGSMHAKANLGTCSNSEKDLKEHPWCGAQSTVQRWWADPVLNDKWDDITMRAVFTHDHYGPSSHQQHGFYAALIVEPKDTVWTKIDTSPATTALNTVQCNPKTLGGALIKPCRNDGGPTSYAANIGFPTDYPQDKLSLHKDEIRREYNLAFADFAILYNADLRPVNPPSRQADLMLPDVVRDGLKPKPEGISTEDPGTRLLNYRNEPIPLRIAEEDSNSLEYHQKQGNVTKKSQGDMANVFSSLAHKNSVFDTGINQAWKVSEEKQASYRIEKLLKNLPHEIDDPVELKKILLQTEKDRRQFIQHLYKNEPWRDANGGDPSTPILAAYAGDPLSLHLIQGAQEEQHVFSMNGTKWLAEPHAKNSGYMNAQQIGISEHFEFDVNLPQLRTPLIDYWYGSPSVENYWDGMWGLLRGFGWGQRVDPDHPTFPLVKGLSPLPKIQKENYPIAPEVKSIKTNETEAPEAQQNLVCPQNEYSKAAAHQKNVVAILAEDLLNDMNTPEHDRKNYLEYNKRFKITDPQAIVFVELDESWVAKIDSEEQQKSLAQLNGIQDLPGLDRPSLNQLPKTNKSVVLPPEKIVEELRRVYSKGKVLEPLVLRANAGDCIRVVLHNLLPENFSDGSNQLDSRFNRWSYNMVPPITSGFNFNQVRMSSVISLTPQLVTYHAGSIEGGNTGKNPENSLTVNSKVLKTKGLPGCRKIIKAGNYKGRPDYSACKKQNAEYIWYAGDRRVISNTDFDLMDQKKREAFCAIPTPIGHGYLCHTPMEFGVVSLRSFGDVIKQSSHGAVGALVIEPPNSKVNFPVPADKSDLPDFYRSRTTADIVDQNGKTLFREFVVVFQDDLSLLQNNQVMPNHRMADDAEDTGQKGFNYHSEPLWARNGVGTSGADFNVLNGLDYTNTLSSIAVNPGCAGICGDPETPVFNAIAGSNIRFRLIHPGGHSRQHAFALYGHNWDYQPWMNASTAIANTDQKEIKTALLGAIGGIGPGRHFNLVTKAGGVSKLPGDYLFRVQENFQFHGGMWGILRVE